MAIDVAQFEPLEEFTARVDRMIEHTKILKALFAEEPVTFHGEHYTITDLPGMPKPYTPGVLLNKVRQVLDQGQIG